MLERCTARALDCWREHAARQQWMFGVAGKVSGRMQHRYCRSWDQESQCDEYLCLIFYTQR